jgi:hypothetical protein
MNLNLILSIVGMFVILGISIAVILHYYKKNNTESNSLKYTEETLKRISIPLEGYADVQLTTNQTDTLNYFSNLNILKDFYNNICKKSYPTSDNLKNVFSTLIDKNLISSDLSTSFGSLMYLPILKALMLEPDELKRKDFIVAFFILIANDPNFLKLNPAINTVPKLNYDANTKIVIGNYEAIGQVINTLTNEEKLKYKIPDNSSMYRFTLDDFATRLYNDVKNNFTSLINSLKNQKIYLSETDFNILSESEKQNSYLLTC